MGSAVIWPRVMALGALPRVLLLRLRLCQQPPRAQCISTSPHTRGGSGVPANGEGCPGGGQKGRPPVRVGCASGFWGDTAAAVPQLVYGGKLDFLVFDYLSEITMSLLTAAKSKSPRTELDPAVLDCPAPPLLGVLSVSRCPAFLPLLLLQFEASPIIPGSGGGVSQQRSPSPAAEEGIVSARRRRQRLPASDQNMGYAPDFVHTAMAPFIKEIHKKGIRVVSNAGGTNPHACAAALHEIVKKSDLDLKIAVVTGDDVMAEKKSLTEAGVTDLESGKPFPDSINSMHAYLGARPISRALDLGADIVVTGRCVDSSVVLGPLIHSFGWKRDEFDLLAAGSLAGHLIECGAQCTGGIFTDWRTVPDWHNIGFPIVECSPNGQFVLSKPPNTGGLVSFGTAAEQLVYEIGDPQRYLLPDVTCDFSDVSITEITGAEGGAVTVEKAKGSPPSTFYKVCATYFDGFRATAVFTVGGQHAVEKGRRTAESIVKRTRHMFEQLGFEDYSGVNIQILGAEDTYGPHATEGKDGTLREVVVWLAVHHKQKKAVELFSREIAPAGTGMAPGLTAIVGGRPKVSPVLKPFFFLYPKEKVKIDIFMNGEHIETFREDQNLPADVEVPQSETLTQDALKDLPSGPFAYRLEELAYTRSGDKGNTANIGVIARHPLYYPYIKRALTAQVVEEYFLHLIEKEHPDENVVTRFTLPGVNGLNFVLKNSLGGGGIASLRSDPQGKAYGQMLLDFQITNVPDLKSLIE